MLKQLKLIITGFLLLFGATAYAYVDAYLYGTTPNGYQIQPISAVNVNECDAQLDNASQWRSGSAPFQLSHCQVATYWIQEGSTVRWNTTFDFKKTGGESCTVEIQTWCPYVDYVLGNCEAKWVSGCEDVISSFDFTQGGKNQLNVYAHPQLKE